MSYIVPSSSTPLPGSLTLNQFIQTVLVGISGLTGSNVRPRFQPNPPKQPSQATNWMAFAVMNNRPDTYGYNGLNSTDDYVSQRHETLEVQCAFYGPECYEYASLVVDGFQIQQNLEALRSANMGFINTGDIIRVPDFVNEQFIDRVEITVYLRREIQRDYPVLSLVDGNGTIQTILDSELNLIEWQTKPEET